ncbi:DNA replication/repair protein RecF [Jeotgalibaca ciconiae]|uniref:DNA replication and repair protein RecF n=1 Tax=Jeotgalibaca ciconiae TaxID=2496265 RepID=A0A3S9HA25_9LACT|nr:DNA replication/repair protein RecF [Jeotgalibaca ciconiae]AZP04240.1 DNA replication/repair protein RecF [Jeotgalibaca ciconiae]HJB24462.1 DNA replication/repair protein RecF [Candidatus Jeotgalibaca pullicola]
MILKEITLRNFRNYSDLALSFSNGINVFLGENAQGKTNLMEAIYALSMARSPRTSNEKEMIQWQNEGARISGQIERRNADYPLELFFSKKGKIAKINHIEQKRLSDYVGTLNVVLFAPEDLELVKGSPNRRRKFLDMELGQMSQIYLHNLVEYQRLLKQRNLYLKQLLMRKANDLVYLDVLTEQVATLGATIIEARLHFIQQLEKWADPLHYQISDNKEHLHIRYKSPVPFEEIMSKEEIYLLLMEEQERVKQREREQGTTLFGPHRDDLVFYVNDKNIHQFGSQGQQRTTVLSLKLAEIECMKEVLGEYPILLLDDVLSELDDNRQTHLLKTIEKKVQTFLTTTSLDGVKRNKIEEPTVFHIEAGTVEKEGA